MILKNFQEGKRPLNSHCYKRKEKKPFNGQALNLEQTIERKQHYMMNNLDKHMTDL
jgi:hypothetical protein